ncbi:MAG TPA: HDIG domain-containing protein [Aggregatilineaceae bacterium]|nr:HDIG domain-containing protein [Aggregatilineaceae bacterium]
MNQRQTHTNQLLRRAEYVLLLVLFIVIGALIAAYDALIPSSSKVSLAEGQVAPRDILAPRALKYESEVLTEAKRSAAADAVRPMYDPPDPSVGAEQIQLARQILDYLENIRSDDFATLEQKKQDIALITDLPLEEAVVEAILSNDENTWQAIDAQIIRLLERVMSGEVRADNIQSKRDSLPNLISASYSETEVSIIKAIVSGLMQVNAFYNEEATREAQTEAAENVPVEMRTFARGQMIIRAGEIATAAHIEALDRVGLLQVNQRRSSHFFSGLLSMSLVAALLGIYLRQFYPRVYNDPKLTILLGMLFLIFLAGTRIVSRNEAIQPYYYPASAFAFLVSTLVGPQMAVVMIVTLAGLVGYMTGNSLEFTLLIGFAGTAGILTLGHTERFNSYFMAGGAVGLASASIALLFALNSDTSVDWLTTLKQIMGSLFINGLLSAALALVGLFVIGYLLNIPTSIKIIELLQPNHALLQRLLREAPGTYQHSLQVANLAELGAQQVNANGSLLRVAAMYHDVGKILNPHFFVENQAENLNPHDVLDDPYQSARIIIGHVSEGERLGRRYRLPSRIRDFIVEHHGTTQVVYFYRKALEEAEKNHTPVDIQEFTYPGPRPQSRETAILMLADGCESSVRARRPQSKQDIQETVDFIFESRLREGQLDESGLTLNDLRTLRETFLTALQGIFHPRIAYPGTPGQQPGALRTGQFAALPATTNVNPLVGSDVQPVGAKLNDHPTEKTS